MFSACGPSKKAQAKKINDSTAIYSSSTSRPFKYGFALTKSECNYYFQDYLNDYKFKKGEVIADVGAASGWIEGAFSVLLDSLTFYIQDIDTSWATNAEMDKVVNYYSSLRQTSQTNSFHFILGDEKKTNLPDSTFDKVILNNTFHEIVYVDDMLTDIGKKLKPNGKLIIREGFSNSYKTKRLNGCNIKAYRVDDVVDYLKYHGFYLTCLSQPESSFTNCLTFEKNESLSYDFADKMGSVDIYIRELEKLNSKLVSRDSLKTALIGNILKKNIEEISSVYNSLEIYINSLGIEWLKEKKVSLAINVFKINIFLYPESSKTFESLGDAYIHNKQYDKAIINYTKALEINPDNIDNKKIIIELEKEFKKKRHYH